VHDDGQGFDPTVRTQGFGLTGIRERVELLEGELEISSAPGKGTTLSVALPSRRAAQPVPADVVAVSPVAIRSQR
jgi:two-component system sensor histidine kinase UhpB